jgi:hypothetical protein
MLAGRSHGLAAVLLRFVIYEEVEGERSKKLSLFSKNTKNALFFFFKKKSPRRREDHSNSPPKVEPKSFSTVYRPPCAEEDHSSAVV